MGMRLPKNLYPKFQADTRISSNVMEIMNEIKENPFKVLSSSSTGKAKKQISAYDRNYHIAEYNYKVRSDLDEYFKTYQSNRRSWEEAPFAEKKDVFLKTADLIETKYYDRMLAYTILGQNKTMYEAELDAICELVDFLRFNVCYAERILDKQPIQIPDYENISEYNSFNGFVASITPFNFTAIAGNLASAPLLFGNSVLWKPSESAILSNHLFYEIIHEAGLPEGVLNFCPMEPSEFVDTVVEQPDLSAILFTGSSRVFDDVYRKVGANVHKSKNYVRLIGETGGKNFHFIGPQSSTDAEFLDFVVNKTMESAFNYSGQKCSACSVLYVPESVLDYVKGAFQHGIDEYNTRNDTYGVIHNESYRKLDKVCEDLKRDEEIEFAVWSPNNDETSYYVHPQVVVCRNHEHPVFNTEFFGPILAIYPYDDARCDEAITECIEGNPYSLTGSVFSKDTVFLEKASSTFRHKTGNFYINDKSTGSVVGQQPFGGSGKSGTNDKAGDMNLMYRLFNQRNIKINRELK